MGAISKQFTFSPGATILSSEHNTNFDTLYTLVNGNIDNVNIKSGAAIENAKLNLASISQNISFTGTLDFSGATLTAATTFADLTATTADINGGTLDGVQIGGTTATGELIVNNSSDAADGLGSQGTVGQVLTSAGAGSNPTWALPPSSSNTIFEIHPYILDASTTSVFVAPSNSYVTMRKTKWKKISGVSIITIYVQGRTTASNESQFTCKVDVGGENNSATGSRGDAGGQNKEWLNFDIDVSGLSDGTFYDVEVQVKNERSATDAYMFDLIAFGS